MSDSISNIRNVPSPRPVGPIRRPGKDEKPQDQEADRKEPAGTDDDGSEDTADRDKPLLDEYA
jgi:hypothetical protein